jgi:hypothetical protein
MKRNPHERVVSALFRTRDEVHKTLDALAAIDIPTEDISVIMSQKTFEEEEFSEVGGVRFHDESVRAAKIGGIAGAVVAGLTAMAGMASGGAELLVAGPVVALISGFGSLLGTLIGGGFTEEEAKTVDQAIREGKILLTVHNEGHRRAKRVEEILKECRGEQVHHC